MILMVKYYYKIVSIFCLPVWFAFIITISIISIRMWIWFLALCWLFNYCDFLTI